MTRRYFGFHLKESIAAASSGGAGGVSAPVNTVAPTISGTGTVGQTLTRVAGTWTGADSVTGQWRSDSVAISGQTGSTYVVQSGVAGTLIDYYETALKGATPAYKGSNGIAIGAAVSTDGLYNGNNNSGATIAGTVAGGTFPDNTIFATAYPDLALTGTTAQMTVNNGGQMQFGGTAAGDRALKTAGGADWVTSWTAVASFSPPRFVWDFVDTNNYKYLNIALGDNGYTPHTVASSVDTAGTFVGFGASVVATDTFVLSRSGSTMSITRNGVAAGSGWTAAVVNNVTGWMANGSGHRWDDWLLQSASNPISITSASVNNDGYFVVAGNYGTPTPTTVQIRRYTSDGTLSVDWETCTGTISGGSYSVTSATKAGASVQGTNARVQVRASNNTTVERSALVAVPLFQTIFPFQKGMNETNMSTPGSGYARNLMLQASYRSNSYADYYIQPGQAATGTQIPSSQSGMLYDGTIQSYGGSNTLIRAILKELLPATGSYTLTYPAGMTLSAALGGHATVTSNSGGVAVFNFTDASWPNGEVEFQFTGGTNGSLGFKPTLTRNADANPSRLYADSTLSAWAAMGGVQWIRNMDPSGVNLDPVARTSFSTERWTGPITMGASDIANMIAFANAAGINPRLNISPRWSAGYLASYATYVAQNLSPTLTAGLEFSNEVWNRVTFDQGNRIGVDACQRGLWNTLGNATPITIRTDGIDANPYYTSTSGALTATFATGEYVYANYGGWQVFRAKKANAIGAGDGLSNPAAWDIAITGAEVTRAMKRAYAELAVAAFSAFDTAFTAAGYNPRLRTKRILAWQASTGYTEAQDILAWNNTYLNYDEFNVGPYWGGGYGGYNLGDYDSNYPGWGATEKALVATNAAAFRDAFFAIAPTAVDAAVDATRDYKHGLARWLNSTYGLAMDARSFGSYEAHWHWITLGGWNAAINTVLPTIVADARFATMFTRYAQGLRDKVGGPHNFYVRSQGPWSALPFYNWGFQQSDTDTSNALFTAFAALS